MLAYTSCRNGNKPKFDHSFSGAQWAPCGCLMGSLWPLFFSLCLPTDKVAQGGACSQSHRLQQRITKSSR